MATAPQPPITSAFSALPAELITQILSYLAIPSLASFAQTSHSNHAHAATSLKTLNLAVFTKRIHGILAFLYQSPFPLPTPTHTHTHNNTYIDFATPTPTPTHHNAALRHAPPSKHFTTPQAYRASQIQAQNALATKILSSPLLAHLRDLTLHSYSCQSPALVAALARLPLKRLSLNCAHPAVHDSCLPAGYWARMPVLAEAEGMSGWDLFGGGQRADLGGGGGGLEELCLARVAIEGAQLGRWVGRNAATLRRLEVRLVAGVDARFVDALGDLALRWRGSCGLQPCQHRRGGEAKYRNKDSRVGYAWSVLRGTTTGGCCGGLKLETLLLQDCANLTLRQPEDFAWIEALLGAGLRWLSLRGCSAVDLDVLREVGKERGWFEPRLWVAGDGRSGAHPEWEYGLVVLELLEDDAEDLETRSLGELEIAGDSAGKGEERIEIDPLF
jgi:hypothetical protein